MRACSIERITFEQRREGVEGAIFMGGEEHSKQKGLNKRRPTWLEWRELGKVGGDWVRDLRVEWGNSVYLELCHDPI